MRNRLRSLCLVALIALLGLVVGCERTAPTAVIAEIDETNYRRGKDLLRQGRAQEALGFFLKLIDERGSVQAPESHLEAALIYQQHVKDPIAAIYHFRKYRELRPNSQQADLVRQSIDASIREFARTLPGQPLENQLQRFDVLDQLEKLQRENELLKADLASARALAGRRTSASSHEAAGSPAVAPLTDEPAVSTAHPPAALPQRTPTALPSPTSPTLPARQPPSRPTTNPGARQHVVVRGDTLYNLAVRYYGTGSRWPDIQAANRDVIKNNEDIPVGVTLTIP